MLTLLIEFELLEGIAALAGFDEAGGAKGYRPVDHSRAIEATGGRLAKALRASWLPKLSNGWFFRAESFFSVAPISTKPQMKVTARRRTSCHTRTAKDSYGYSTNGAVSKDSTSSTNRNRPCRRHDRSNC
jgi:predicted ATPase